MAALAAPISPYGQWLQGVLNDYEIGRSTLYRLYVRCGGNRSLKTLHNWCNGTNMPDIYDGEFVLRALETAVPDSATEIRKSYEALLRSFDRAPRGNRGILEPVSDGVPLVAAAKRRTRITVVR